MQCPFKYKWRSYSSAASGDFIIYSMEIDAKNEREYNINYPTCWNKFLHWLDIK